jgi:hypothetical protein
MENRQGVNQQDDERTSLVFSVRGPIPIQLGNFFSKISNSQNSAIKLFKTFFK